MGDVVLTIPVISFLKQMYPDSKVTLLTDKLYVSLFVDDNRISSVVGIDKSEDVAQLPILKEPWDLVVDLQNNTRSKILRTCTNDKKKIGIFNKLHIQRFLLLLFRINAYPRYSNVVYRYLKAAGADDSTLDQEHSLCLQINKKSIEQYASIIQSDTIVRPTIALFPFSAWKNKEWPIQYFSIVGRFFIANGWNVIILGSQAEREQANQLRLMIGNRSQSLAGKFSLYECASILKNCSLSLGNDSGLFHLARACGVKSGVIYGPTTFHFGFYPYGKPLFKIFESKLFCRPCHAHGGNHCIRLDKKCMINISPEKVIKEMISLFNESQSGSRE
jgi:heptosyltransferase-2